jgi:prolipoprotein diacylglyceryltransferase
MTDDRSSMIDHRSRPSEAMGSPAPVSPNPLGTDAPTTDHVGLAMAAIGTAAAVAVAWFAVLTLVVATLRDPTVQSAEAVNPDALYVNLFLFGIPAGLAIAGLTGWILMRPVDSLFRRGGLAIVGALAGTVLAMMLTFTAHAAFGTAALAALGVLALVVAFRLGSRARRAA